MGGQAWNEDKFEAYVAEEEVKEEKKDTIITEEVKTEEKKEDTKEA